MQRMENREGTLCALFLSDSLLRRMTRKHTVTEFENVISLYEALPAGVLRLLRRAFELDRDRARKEARIVPPGDLRLKTTATAFFCSQRIRLIDDVLKKRSKRQPIGK